MPITAETVIRAKFYTNLIPLVCLSQALLLISNIQTDASAFFFLFSHVICFFQTIAIVMMALYASLAAPPHSQSSLERAAGSTGGLLFMMGGSLYILGTVSYFTAPIYRALLMRSFSSEFEETILVLFILFVATHVCFYMYWIYSMPGMFSRSKL